MAGPLLSLVSLPSAVVPSARVRATITSILQQAYPDWELWLPSALGRDLDDERARTRDWTPEVSDAAWFARAASEARGSYLLPLPPFATLRPEALSEIALSILASPDPPELVYSDEEHETSSGDLIRSFKPGWDPELMMGRDAVGDLRAFRTARVREVGGPDTRWPRGTAFLYDLVLRAAAMPESGPSIHLPTVLCTTPLDVMHSRALDGVTARAVTAAHLERLGASFSDVVSPARAPSWSRVIWTVPDPPPRVSVIVPTRDQPVMLERCAHSVLSVTAYPDLELLIVDNGSSQPETMELLDRLALDARVTVLRADMPFNFSTLNNLAARRATGSILMLLNDDTEAIHPDWLRELVSHAIRPDVGMVGARLLFPDDRIQHAGLVMVEGGVHHQFRFEAADQLGPAGELALTRSVSGVTGACVALRRSIYEEVGGLDEAFSVAYGDVDLCLRIAARGYRLICSSFAELYHHESASRGYEDTPAKKARHDAELDGLRQRWGAVLHTERFANPELRRIMVQATISSGADTSLEWPQQGRRLSLISRLSQRVVNATRARATILVPNPLFSRSWYLARYPEVAGYRLGPYRHYRRHGVREARDRNLFFETRWYVDRYRDVAASGDNPLDHYLRYGASEGRDPGPRFSTNWYLSAYPDVRESGQNPLLHYLRHGQREGRTPRP